MMLFGRIRLVLERSLFRVFFEGYDRIIGMVFKWNICCFGFGFFGFREVIGIVWDR